MNNGRFVLTFRGKRWLQYQGHISKHNEDGTVHVRLFSWLDGKPNGTATMDAAQLDGALYFETGKEMREVGTVLFDVDQMRRRNGEVEDYL